MAVGAVHVWQAGHFTQGFFKRGVTLLGGLHAAAQCLEDLRLGFFGVQRGKAHFIGLEQGVLFARHVGGLEAAAGEHAVE